MTKLYTNSDYLEAMKQRRRLLAGFWAATILFLTALIASVVIYCFLPFQDPNAVWCIIVASVVTAAYIVFCFPYMGISYKRSKAYCKMLGYLSAGLKESAELSFTEVEDWTTRDGVDVNVAVFSIKNPKGDEALIRHIYIDGEKDYPPFQEGDTVKMITQGNLLIAYEIE